MQGFRCRSFKLSLCLAVVVAAIVFGAGPLRAQPEPVPSITAATTTPTGEDNPNPQPALKVETADDLEKPYVESSLENLSKMYWALGGQDPNDVEAVDNFLKIHHCDLYTSAYRNDFQLQELRQATRESIAGKLSEFPTKIEVKLEIGLDRYDIQTERFRLATGSQFLSSKRFEFAGGNPYGAAICRSPVPLPKYPNNMILTINRPLTLTEISVPPEVAKKYIEFTQTTYRLSEDVRRLSPLGRIAYLTFKINVNQFNGFGRGSQSESTVAFLSGVIDSYEVHADRDRTFLLYNQQVAESMTLKRRKKDKSPIVIGDGPLLKPTVPKDEVKNPEAGAETFYEEKIVPLVPAE